FGRAACPPRQGKDTVMLEQDRELLERMLATAVAEGPQAAAAAAANELAAICRAGAAGDASDESEALAAAAGRIELLATDEILRIIRFITARFHLLNKAEQLNIAHVN